MLWYGSSLKYFSTLQHTLKGRELNCRERSGWINRGQQTLVDSYIRSKKSLQTKHYITTYNNPLSHSRPIPATQLLKRLFHLPVLLDRRGDFGTYIGDIHYSQLSKRLSVRAIVGVDGGLIKIMSDKNYWAFAAVICYWHRALTSTWCWRPVTRNKQVLIKMYIFQQNICF